jgi:hypothetical protein
MTESANDETTFFIGSIQLCRRDIRNEHRVLSTDPGQFPWQSNQYPDFFTADHADETDKFIREIGASALHVAKRIVAA